MTSRLRRLSSLVVSACLVVALLENLTPSRSHASQGNSTRSLRARTVFGLGPELHLLPNFGRVGTRVLVAGLGYPPYAHVSIYYGGFQASFMPTPIVSAMTSAAGTFRASFTVDCRFVTLFTTHALHPPRSCSTSRFLPVALGGFIGHNFIHKETAVEAFVVTG